MPVNRNALIRYKTIDKCLQNRYRQWTLEDLIDACSDALYEYEGIDKGVSKRTVQGDIQIMRSGKLGYNAPIIVIDKKYYTYEDADYSITNIPLSDQDLGMLTEAVSFMKQFKGFSHFRELEGMIQKLEDHIYSQQTATNPVIDFEKNDNLKGLEYLDKLYQTIIKEEAIAIQYQSFKARKPSSFDFHPYLLKEFRNRWFVIGRKEDNPAIMNLALDRILEIKESELAFRNAAFDYEDYFKNVIGVSVSPNMKVEDVILFINHNHAPYVITKPLHPSQKVIERDHYGVTISLQVQLNYELEKVILGLGEAVRVIAPQRLKRNIQKRLTDTVEAYQSEISEKGLKVALARKQYKGMATLHRIYTQREIRHIMKHIQRIGIEKLTQGCNLLDFGPAITNLLINKNIRIICQQINNKASLLKATYFEHAPKEKQYQQWHQSVSEATFNFVLQIHLNDTSVSNGLQSFLPGSHGSIHSQETIDIITQNSIPWQGEMNVGSALLLNPMLLTRFEVPKSFKKRKVIRLEFGI